MNSVCDEHTIDIIALKRPTTLDKLLEAIPKPKGAIPNFGLPKWKVMPLESKIPMVPGPEGAYNFTRRKVGQKLWIPSPDAEFNLSDPYCYEMKLSYDSLHDKHLVPYFSRPNNIRHLIKAGLITKNLDAKCSLRDYNMYRKYLRRLHCDSMKKELNKRTKQSIEERAIQYAQEQADKEVKRLKEREKLMELRRNIIKNRKIAEKLKLQKQKEKQQKIEERLQALLQKKREARHLRYIESKARAELIQQKQKAAAEIERQKIIQTFLEWNRKERIRKKTRQMRLAHEHEQKRKIVEQKWKERQEFQKKQIEKEQFLLKCIEDQRKSFIQAYNEKIDKETERMKKLLKDVKMYIRCYLARRAAGKERICCEKYSDDDMDKESSLSMKDAKKSHMSKLQIYSAPIKKGKDKALKAKDISPKTRKVVTKKSDTKIRKKAGTKAKKRTDSKVRKRKTFRVQKGSKRRRKRKKKRKAKKEIDESEEKSEMEAIQESISTLKTETSDTSTTSEPKDHCRCQLIKDAQKAIKT